MKINSAKIVFLFAVLLAFSAGYASDQLRDLKDSLSSKVTGLKSNWSEPAKSPDSSAPTADANIPGTPILNPTAPNSASNSEPVPARLPISPPKTGDLKQALDGIGQSGLDTEMVKQRKDYLKKLDAEIKERQGGEAPLPPPKPTTPPANALQGGIQSPDLLPQIAPPPLPPSGNSQAPINPAPIPPAGTGNVERPLIQQTNVEVEEEEEESDDGGADLEDEDADSDDSADDAEDDTPVE